MATFYEGMQWQENWGKRGTRKGSTRNEYNTGDKTDPDYNEHFKKAIENLPITVRDVAKAIKKETDYAVVHTQEHIKGIIRLAKMKAEGMSESYIFEHYWSKGTARNQWQFTKEFKKEDLIFVKEGKFSKGIQEERRGLVIHSISKTLGGSRALEGENTRGAGYKMIKNRRLKEWDSKVKKLAGNEKLSKSERQELSGTKTLIELTTAKNLNIRNGMDKVDREIKKKMGGNYKTSYIGAYTFRPVLAADQSIDDISYAKYAEEKNERFEKAYKKWKEYAILTGKEDVSKKAYKREKKENGEFEQTYSEWLYENANDIYNQLGVNKGKMYYEVMINGAGTGIYVEYNKGSGELTFTDIIEKMLD